MLTKFQNVWQLLLKRNIHLQSYCRCSRRVLVSTSNDIYTNLALEDWLYRNENFENDEILLMWRNKACVVVGRHQNPWLECNLDFLNKNDISLARRNSGGGTVYHDMGNLNCTFFVSRKKHNRKVNLQLICNALVKNWQVDAQVSQRDDILIDNKFKISGTAAKLGNPNSYHHCTVLFDVNKWRLQKALDKQNKEMESNATPSVRGSVKNLRDVKPEIDYWPLIEAISSEYLQKNVAWKAISPITASYPGLDKILSDLKKWEWIYGHTPRFTLTKQYAVATNIRENPVYLHMQEGDVQRELSVLTSAEETTAATLTLKVYHGQIEDFSISPETFLENDALLAIQSLLTNKQFKSEVVDEQMNHLLYNNTCFPNHTKLKFVSKCLKDMIEKA